MASLDAADAPSVVSCSITITCTTGRAHVQANQDSKATTKRKRILLTLGSLEDSDLIPYTL